MSYRGNRWMRVLSWIGTWVMVILALVALALLPGWMLPVLLLPLALWLFATRTGRQAWSATQVGIATIPQRLGSSSVVVVGIAGVVGVLVALLAMAAGFAATLKQGGNDDTAIVLRGGAQTELNSVINHETVTLVSQQPQVRHDRNGQPIASGELVVVAALPKRSTGLDANVEVRGVGERAWELRPGLHIIDGRKFTPGLRELIVGKRAREQFAGRRRRLDAQAERPTVARGRRIRVERCQRLRSVGRLRSRGAHLSSWQQCDIGDGPTHGAGRL